MGGGGGGNAGTFHRIIGALSTVLLGCVQSMIKKLKWITAHRLKIEIRKYI